MPVHSCKLCADCAACAGWVATCCVPNVSHRPCPLFVRLFPQNLALYITTPPP